MVKDVVKLYTLTQMEHKNSKYMKIINCFRQRARKYSKKRKDSALKYPGIEQVKKQDLVTVNKSASLGYQPSKGK